jgi:hypothetical protein
MIVAYDLRGILAYGQSEVDVMAEALTYWEGKAPFRVSLAQATPALEEFIRMAGKDAECGECRDGRLGTVAETPSAKGQGGVLPSPGRMEAARATGPASFSRHVHGTVSAPKEAEDGGDHG